MTKKSDKSIPELFSFEEQPPEEEVKKKKKRTYKKKPKEEEPKAEEAVIKEEVSVEVEVEKDGNITLENTEVEIKEEILQFDEADAIFAKPVKNIPIYPPPYPPQIEGTGRNRIKAFQDKIRKKARPPKPRKFM